MNARAMLAIVRKDLKVVIQNKNIVTPIIIIIVVFFIGFPWLAGLAPTLIKGLGGQVTSLEGILTKMPAGMLQELAGYSISQKVIVFVLVYMRCPSS